MRRGPRRDGGFTMIELLVTLAVAGIALAGVLATLLVASRTNAGASTTADAVSIAERTVEEARGLSLDEMFVAYEDDDAALPIDHDFGAATVQGRIATYLRRIVVEDIGEGTGLVRIRVEVTWADEGGDVTDPDRQHRVALELLRTRQEAL